MHYRAISVSSIHPDPDLLQRLFFVEQVCLALVVQIAVLGLCGHMLPALGRIFPASFSALQSFFALAVLFSVSSLFLLDADGSTPLYGLSRIFALFAGASALVSTVEASAPSDVSYQPGLQTFLIHHTGLIPGIALLLIATVLFLAKSRSRALIRIADLATVALCLVVLILAAEVIYTSLEIPGSSTIGLPSLATFVCLVLLAVALAFRQAERGAFSIFLGPGIGGKLARIATPILVFFPMAREAARARVLNAHFIPPHYAMAILASVGTAVSFGLLFLLVRHLNKLESEIKDLTLRDELTGLYNVRGFNLLAGQSLRLAQRAELPFSVLFIDVDDLKRINDELGHNIGSASLAEAAKLLDTTFRDADVIARIGGDEFAVAGQFNHEAIAAAAQRLHDAAAARSCEPSQPFPLSLSIGHATSSMFRFDTLKELLARADQAMYDRKRRKKDSLPEVAVAG